MNFHNVLFPVNAKITKKVIFEMPSSLLMYIKMSRSTTFLIGHAGSKTICKTDKMNNYDYAHRGLSNT